MNIPNRTTVISLLLAFLIGGIAGAYISYHVANQYSEDSSMLSLATNAELETSALRALRAKDTEGTFKLLEAILDSKIIFLRIDDSYSDLTNNAVRRAIQQAKDYRAQYPRKSDYPETDAKVIKVLDSMQNVPPLSGNMKDR